MEWIHVLTIIFSNIALFLWVRTESRADMRAFSNEIRGWKDEINKEMKDFHGRLCSIEERKKTDP